MVTPWEDLADHPPAAFVIESCLTVGDPCNKSVLHHPFVVSLSNHPSASRPFDKLRGNGRGALLSRWL